MPKRKTATQAEIDDDARRAVAALPKEKRDELVNLFLTDAAWQRKLNALKR